MLTKTRTILTTSDEVNISRTTTMTTTKNEDENVGYSITSDEGDNNETIMRTRATTKTQGDDEGEPNGKDDDDHRDDDGKHEDADDEGNHDTDVDENDTKHE